MLETVKAVLANRRGNRRNKYVVTFSSGTGAEVLKDMCRNAYIAGSTYVKGDHDRTLMNEGARNFVLGILKTLNFDPQTMAEQLHTTTDDDL